MQKRRVFTKVTQMGQIRNRKSPWSFNDHIPSKLNQNGVIFFKKEIVYISSLNKHNMMYFPL